MKENNIEIRSEEFQEVLGKIPPWILRWGIAVVGIIVILILLGCAIFKYPDTISSAITLTGKMPATNMIARSSGKISKIYVDDNQHVKQGDYIAVIENSAEITDMMYLKDFLLHYRNSLDSISSLPRNNLRLGTCQSLYASYHIALFQYLQFKELGYYKEKVEMIRHRIYRNEQYYNNLLRQQDLICQQQEIMHKQYSRDSLLRKQGLISDEALEQTYNQYLQGQLSTENMFSTLENLQIQLSQMREMMADTEYQYVDKKTSLETQVEVLCVQLLTEIQAWELDYAFIAPIAGKVTFTNYWIENQNVTAGDIAFSIIPVRQDKLTAKALLPAERSGKVKIGQNVNIHFSNFPDMEYGVVKGV